jgi:hypothetical protein
VSKPVPECRPGFSKRHDPSNAGAVPHRPQRRRPLVKPQTMAQSLIFRNGGLEQQALPLRQ